MEVRQERIKGVRSRGMTSGLGSFSSSPSRTHPHDIPMTRVVSFLAVVHETFGKVSRASHGPMDAKSNTPPTWSSVHSSYEEKEKRQYKTDNPRPLCKEHGQSSRRKIP